VRLLCPALLLKGALVTLEAPGASLFRWRSLRCQESSLQAEKQKKTDCRSCCSLKSHCESSYFIRCLPWESIDVEP
jgi:hypothetical protein